MNIVRAFLVWLVIMLAETAHGLVRVSFLQPLVGDLRARQIGVFVGTVLILAVAYMCSPWLRVRASRPLLAIGLLWVVLTLMFEIALGRAVFGLSWVRILADYDLSQGGLMLFGILFLGVAPLVAARLREHFATATQHRAALYIQK